MKKQTQKFTVNASFPEPSTQTEVNRNINEIGSFLNQYKYRNYNIDYLVLFLIHYSIEPEFRDFNVAEYIPSKELFDSWELALEDRKIIITVNKKYFKNSDFKILEAYFECKYTEHGASVTIPISRIRSFQCSEKNK